MAVFAGRHIPEKRVPALVPALAPAREQVPELRGEIYGDGPERERRPRKRSQRSGLERSVSAPGFVEQDVLEQALATALCLVLPSRREGYGLVVIESAARGVPSVVVEALTTRRLSSSTRARTARSLLPRRPMTSPLPSFVSTRPDRSYAARRSSGFAATPSGFRLTTLFSSCCASIRPRIRRSPTSSSQLRPR